MKICAIICEYNPFHNGHAYLLRKVRAESGCDAVVCVMSGNFTQRGEAALFDKYTRAAHAIRGGADAVIELPAVFATSPAEIFALGGVKLLNAIPAFEKLAFGCEQADRRLILSAAKLSADEGHTFRSVLHKHLKAGIGLPLARNRALSETGAKEEAELLQKPNNILGVEYQKALLRTQSRAQIFPVRREGAGFSDAALYKDLSSAAAIRKAVREGKLRAAKKNVPAYVAADFSSAADEAVYRKIALYCAVSSPADRLRRIADCSEGLENRIRALARSNPDYDEFIAKATTKRYISSRIRRILTAAVLGIDKELVQKCLRAPLYLRVLAVSRCRADEMLAALGGASFPVLTRKRDFAKLNKTAMEALEKDRLASDIYALIGGSPAVSERMLVL